MKLKANINYTEFLLRARTCHGDVFFCTPAGDRLNLKSILCEFVFVSADPTLLKNGEVVCVDPADRALLSEYVEAM